MFVSTALCCAIAVLAAHSATAAVAAAAAIPAPDRPLEAPAPDIEITCSEPELTLADLLATGIKGEQRRFHLNAEQRHNARRIVEVVERRGMPAYAAVVALATALQESTLRNLTVPVDYDSLGLFQQRPSAGWGTPEQLTDPGYATAAFLDALEDKVPNYSSIPLWEAAQGAQVSAFPVEYAKWQEQAAQLTLELLVE
ncbi:hypothetical protein AB0H76_30210 [Nocardia sp. NPDC050712]|uniref:hypothetical protein n=1 Tax=Nocardia sp. NPDC050712 TaxID=3155518 RepID=UPI0033DCFCBD